MSERELRGIMDHRNDLSIVDGLRSGRNHRRSVSLSDDNRLNSTSNDSVAIQPVEFSTIRAPDSGLNRVLDMNGSYMESPFGMGVGTRQIRTSEDAYEDDESNVREDYEHLFNQVEKYGLEHYSQVNWKGSIEPEFKRIDVLLMNCLSKLGLVGTDQNITRIQVLRSTLQNYRVDLWKRVRDETDNPIFARVNLSSRVERTGGDSSSYEETLEDSNATRISPNTPCTEGQVDQSTALHATESVDDVFSTENGQSRDISGVLTPSRMPTSVSSQEPVNAMPRAPNSQDMNQVDDGHGSGQPIHPTQPDTIPGIPNVTAEGHTQTPARPAIRRYSTNLINLIDAEKENNEDPQISLTEVLKDLNWPEFATNIEIQQKIAGYDNKVQAMVSEMKDTIKANHTANEQIASQVRRLGRSLETHADNNKKIVGQMNQEVELVKRYRAEQKQVSKDVEEIQANYASLSSAMSGVQDEVRELASNVSNQARLIGQTEQSITDVIEKNSSQDTVLGIIRRDINGISEATKGMAVDSDVQNHIFSLKTKLTEDNESRARQIQQLNTRIISIAERTSAQENRLQAHQAVLRDQKKKYQGIVNSMGQTHRDIQSAESVDSILQPVRPSVPMPTRGVANSPTPISTAASSGHPNQNPEIQIIEQSRAFQSEDTTRPLIETLQTPSTPERSVITDSQVDNPGLHGNVNSNQQERLLQKDSNVIVHTAQLIAENNIRSLITQLNAKTKVVISSDSSEMLIKESKTQSIPSIERIVNTCYTALAKYSTYPDIDQKLCQSAKEAIDNATTWNENVSDLYINSEIYSMNTSKSMAINIEKFTADGSQTIYEFFQDFESNYRGQGSEKQKAEKLYRCYLSDRIMALTSSLSSDFAGLKSFLIKEYGDFITVADSLIRNVEVISKPSQKDYSARAGYFLKIEATLDKLMKLKNQPGIDSVELEDHIYSQPFMRRLVELLPTEDELEYAKVIARRGCDTRKISGEYAFMELNKYCSNEGSANERVAARTKVTKSVDESKSKATHAVHKKVVSSSSDEEAPAVNAVHREKDNGKKSSSTVYDKRWANKKWITPCGILNHDHEVANCDEFFALSPRDRITKVENRICYTCLGPRHMCMKIKVEDDVRRVQCSNYHKARPLVCEDCIEYRKSNQRSSASNILLCVRKHAKPAVEDVSKLLKDYLPNFDVTKITPNLVSYIRRPNKPSVNVSTKKSRSSPVMPGKGEIAINTQTGSKNVLQSSSILTQHTSTPIYITQWIQIGSSKCLCFFDTGANIHMIDGKMAEKEGLKVISQAPTSLKVVGGSEMVTDYGKYKLNLGPIPDQKFQELTCHGMSRIAGPFPRFNLQEVNSEVRSQQTVSAEEKLPEYVAGSVVHLLIGISESAAHPVRIATLPSGISVYRSPFTDIFGSNICYGGSHDSFNGSSVPSGSNHAVFLINTLNVVKDSMLMSAKDTVKANESDLLPLSVHDSEVKAKDALGSIVSQSRTRAATPNWDPRSCSQSGGQSCLGSTVSRSRTRAPAPKRDCLLTIQEHHDRVVPFHVGYQSRELNEDPSGGQSLKDTVSLLQSMVKLSDLDGKAQEKEGNKLTRMNYCGSDILKMCNQLQLYGVSYPYLLFVLGVPESLILVSNMPGILGFMDKLAKQGVLKSQFVSWLHLLYLPIANKSPPAVPASEKFILEDHRCSLAEVDARLDKLERDFDYCEKVKTRLKGLKDVPEYRNRSDWKVWVMGNQPAKLKFTTSLPSCSRKRSRFKSVKSRLGRSQSRSRTRAASSNRGLKPSCRSVKSRLDGAVFQSWSWAPNPNRGRSLTVKLDSFREYYQEIVGYPSILFCALSRSCEPDEHSSGGRLAKSKNNQKSKGKVSTEPARMMTQDEMEEEVSHNFQLEPVHFNFKF